MTNQMQELLNMLTDPQAVTMVGKSNGMSDTVLASRLGCSRPTVIKYRQEYTDTVGRFLRDEVPPELYPLATELLLERALEQRWEPSDDRS